MTDASDLSHPHDEGSLSANEAMLCGATALRERPLRGVPGCIPEAWSARFPLIKKTGLFFSGGPSWLGNGKPK